MDKTEKKTPHVKFKATFRSFGALEEYYSKDLTLFNERPGKPLTGEDVIEYIEQEREDLEARLSEEARGPVDLLFTVATITESFLNPDLGVGRQIFNLHIH